MNGVARATVVTLLVLSAGGCTGDPAPVGTLPAQTTGATASPTATPPVAPPSEKTPEGAKAFVEFFIETYNYAYETGDSDAVRALSRDSCRFCKDVVSDIDELGAGRIEGSEVEIVAVASPPGLVNGGAVVHLVLNQRPGVYISADGKASKVDGTRNMRSVYGLDWTDDGWRVRGASVDAKEGTPWRAP